MVSTGAHTLDPPIAASQGIVRADYAAAGGRTWAARVHESGGLRLRHPRGPACEAVLVNTAGGIVAGDQLALQFRCAAGAAVTVTSAAAEKIYRSDGREAAMTVELALANGARLAWLPQETILFDGARFRRRFTIDMAADATLVAAEITVFGRTAHGERDPSGSFHDTWRIRSDGRLVFADETRIEGAIGAILDRRAMADGARATAVVLLVAPHAELALEHVRAVLDRFRAASVEGGASYRDGLLHARLVGRAPDQLRAATIAVVLAINGTRMPRSWL